MCAIAEVSKVGFVGLQVKHSSQLLLVSLEGSSCKITLNKMFENNKIAIRTTWQTGNIPTPFLIAKSECCCGESLLEMNFGWPGELSNRHCFKTGKRLKM